jgi:hypothetical protein
MVVERKRGSTIKNWPNYRTSTKPAKDLTEEFGKVEILQGRAAKSGLVLNVAGQKAFKKDALQCLKNLFVLIAEPIFKK